MPRFALVFAPLFATSSVCRFTSSNSVSPALPDGTDHRIGGHLAAPSGCCGLERWPGGAA